MLLSELDLSTVVTVQTHTKIFVMSHKSLGRVCVKQSSPEMLQVAMHEHLVLRALEGVSGVPRVFGLVVEERDGATNAHRNAPNVSYLLSSFFKAAPLHRLFYLSPRFSVPTAATIFKCVANILGEVHAKGVVHCDLKLPNILLKAQSISDEEVIDGNSVVVVDFGSAILVNGPKMPPNEACCTLHTRAPETFYPEKSSDTNCASLFARDFWSFGVCLFEVVAGVPPFGSFAVKSCDISDVRSAICWPDEYAELGLNFSGDDRNGFVSLILALLQLDPRKRLQSWPEVVAHRFFQNAPAQVSEAYIEEAEMQTLGL